MLQRALVVTFLAVLSAACGETSPLAATSTPPAEVVMSRSGGCGDAFFWASTEIGDVAITVSVHARSRSTTEPWTRSFTLPNDEIEVRVERGAGLWRNMCTDVLDSAAEPVNTQEVLAGHGEVVLDPRPPDARQVSGTLRLSGVVAEDGTPFAPSEVASDCIGCYSG